MDRAGLITLEQARAAGLSFDEPEPRACPHCGAALDPLGAALAGRVAWVSAVPCPCGSTYCPGPRQAGPGTICQPQWKCAFTMRSILSGSWRAARASRSS